MTDAGFSLHAVVAMASNRVIGRAGKLPWSLSEDLKFFKKLTWGHPVVMGRRTFDSIGRALPGRRNLIISRSLREIAGAEVLRTPGDLLTLGLRGDVFLIGGEEIFRLLLPGCTSVYLTRVFAEVEGDAFMPPFESEFPLVEKLASFPEFEILHCRRARMD